MSSAPVRPPEGLRSITSEKKLCVDIGGADGYKGVAIIDPSTISDTTTALTWNRSKVDRNTKFGVVFPYTSVGKVLQARRELWVNEDLGGPTRDTGSQDVYATGAPTTLELYRSAEEYIEKYRQQLRSLGFNV